MLVKFRVKSNLIHNKVKFPPGSVIDLDSKEPAAEQLQANGVIERISEKQAAESPGPETTPMESFGAATSPAEVEKAIERAKQEDNLFGYCRHCKAQRKLVDPIIDKSKSGQLNIIAKCSVCNTRVAKLAGKDKK